MLTGWQQDFRYAIRSLAKDRNFTVLAIVALALGIGSATVIFSAIYGVILNTFPYKDSNRLVSFAVHDTTQGGEYGREYLSIMEFLDYRNQNHVFEDMNGGFGGFAGSKFRFSYGDANLEVDGGYLSANTFQFFGVPPILGRWPAPEDTKPGATPVFAMSDRLWARQFNRDPKILGKTFVVNNRPTTLVAIMPPRFRPGWNDVWVQFPLDRSQLAADPEFKDAWVWPMGRLKRGVSVAAAAADLDVVAHHLAQIYPDHYPKQFRITARTLSERVLGPFESLIYPLTGAVILLVLIACSNVANLLLARATVREHEVAIRMSIGAGRMRIVRMFLVESLILAGISCLAGCGLAYMGVRAVVPIIPYNFFPQEAVIELNGHVLLFAIALAAATVLLCGLAPAARLFRHDLQPALESANKGASTPFRHGKLRSALVVAEVALSIMLLVGAGLLMRSFFAVMHVDLGFNPSRILATRIELPPDSHLKPAQSRDFFQQVVERMQSIPGVNGAALAQVYPVEESWYSDITVPGKPHSERWNISVRLCSQDYFRALGVPLLHGRSFTPAEAESEARVAVISQAFARKYFAAGDPIGQTFKIRAFDEWPQAPHDAYFQIVGIARDVRNATLQNPITPEAYIPIPYTWTDSGGLALSLIVESRLEPASLLPAIRQQIWALNRNASLGDEGSLTSFLERDTYGHPKFEFITMTGFAAIGTVLVVIGIFSVMAYIVSLRTHEIGVRMAMGAQQANVLRMVLRKGMTLVVIGIALGLLGSFALMRVLADQIYGISPHDPWTYAVVVLAVAVAGLASCLAPARRAAEVDPMVALRYE